MDRQEIVKGLFCTEISEAYMQIEAPQDFMQIEQVSDTLASCEELQLQNWEQLEVGEKVEVLNDLEARIAAIPEPSSLFPPHTIPLGHPSAPAPSIQYCASNLDWRLVSYMISYMFQCHSPKSSHPLPLPQSPKDCSISNLDVHQQMNG